MSDDTQQGPAIKAVLFDWGGVMESLPDAAAFAAWEARLGLESGRLVEILWGALWEQVEVGAATVEEYGASVCAACGFPDQAALDAFYRAFYPRGARPEMVAAVRALRGRYGLALVTNAWQGQRAHIEELLGARIEDLFDHYVNSAEVGVRKPTPAIFHLALARLGVAPGAAVFIDDNPANIASAGAVGLHTIPYLDCDQVLTALAALLGHPVLPG